mmetsp:Transcript_21574/g.51490  ORF Transcript_21574/g.51490 Transcript_21574/m.51490 type:complete len:206 (+) Transcript_21574:226-843(+)
MHFLRHGIEHRGSGGGGRKTRALLLPTDRQTDREIRSKDRGLVGPFRTHAVHPTAGAAAVSDEPRPTDAPRSCFFFRPARRETGCFDRRRSVPRGRNGPVRCGKKTTTTRSSFGTTRVVVSVRTVRHRRRRRRGLPDVACRVGRACVRAPSAVHRNRGGGGDSPVRVFFHAIVPPFSAVTTTISPPSSSSAPFRPGAAVSAASFR